MTLLFLRMTVDWKWRPYCRFSQEFWSFYLLQPNSCPHRQKQLLPCQGQSQNQNQINVRDSNFPLAFNTAVLPSGLEQWHVLCIHTSGQCNRNMLLNGPCRQSHFPISEWFLTRVCMRVYVCVRSAMCHISFTFGSAGWHDIHFFTSVTSAHICWHDWKERRQLSTVPSELSFFFLDFWEQKHKLK